VSGTIYRLAVKETVPDTFYSPPNASRGGTMPLEIEDIWLTGILLAARLVIAIAGAAVLISGKPPDHRHDLRQTRVSRYVEIISTGTRTFLS
jgi:hypothetical protein